MSLAQNPTWRWIKRETITPSMISRVFRGVTSIALGWIAYRFTGKAVWLLVVFYSSLVLPTVLVTLLDAILRIQFSLKALLITVFTLQIPIAILVTARTDLGVIFGSLLLAIWILSVGMYIFIHGAIDAESSQSGRWSRIEPDETQ